jgi:Zn-dependent peptidase ImmA (M78 family)
MSFRRGFKTEANWYAREVRKELGLAPYSPLCPWKLANHLGFPIVSLSAYQLAAPESVGYLHSEIGQREFSAITLFVGSMRWIIHNDAHDLKRQAANIAHELAHGLLLHPPKPPFDAAGSRHYDKDREDEANWLGPALLISDEAAMHIAARNLSIQAASDHFGASVPLIQMRLNVTGAFARVARRGAAYPIVARVRAQR